MNYYNEWDRHAAAWLRELIKAGHIPKGVVDERSITEVSPKDLKGFTQCHFFAGIGGWSYALRLAGVPDDFPCWTGSPPCQPFSTAGKQLGQLDERHLAPTFMRLVDECKPAILFGEQVAAAIGKHWLDDLFLELERQGYACGASVLPACSVGAPHKRDRLFFGAVNRLANSCRERDHQRSEYPALQRRSKKAKQDRMGCGAMRVADTDGKRLQRKWPDSNTQGRDGSDIRPVGLCDGAGDNPTNPHNSFWGNPDWLGCRDGKFRPVIASFITMVDGLSDSLGCGGYPCLRELSEVFKLPKGVSAEAFFFGCSRKPINDEAKKVLRPELHGSPPGRTDKSIEPEKFSQAIFKNFDGCLYELPEGKGEDACTPQGREPFKQRPIKLDDLMRELSRQSALAELQQRNYDAQALSALRDACAEKWDVQHSFVEVEKAWASFSEEDKERERLGFNAEMWRRVDFLPLSTGEDARVGRLRGYGNAIVPQIAAEFIRGFLDAITDASKSED